MTVIGFHACKLDAIPNKDTADGLSSGARVEEAGALSLARA